MLADIRGHTGIVHALASFAKAPSAKAFIFAGPPGTGKTSAGYALARELGCDLTQSPKECGGLYEIASGEMTAERIRDLKTSMHYRPMFGSGYKVILANEAEIMRDQAECIWLDVLEHLPLKTVCIFTTNFPEKLTRRFRERCETHVFKTPVRGFNDTATTAEIAAQELMDAVWLAELGHNHGPKLADLDGIADNGHLSFRAVLQSLEPLIRAQRDEDGAKAEGERLKAEVAKATPCPNGHRAPERQTVLPSGRVNARAAMDAAAALFGGSEVAS